MIRAILFDFFGTLVDYSASRTDGCHIAAHALLGARGITIEYEPFLRTWSQVVHSLEREAARTCAEYPMERIPAELFARLGLTADEQLLADVVAAYLGEWCTGIRLLPGVAELVSALARRYRLGVVSNTHQRALIDEQLQTMRIEHLFDPILTSIELGVRKPHPRIFRSALAALRLPAREVLFIGDSYEADYRGARRAGLHGVLIDSPGTRTLPAGHRVRSIAELRAHPLLDWA